MDSNKKKKIIEAVKRHKKKRKTEGKVDIAGVKDPHPKNPKPKDVDDRRNRRQTKERSHDKKKPVLLGPRGGKYHLGGQGKKEYQTKQEKTSSTDTKKSLEGFVQAGNDLIKSFIKKIKGNSNE